MTGNIISASKSGGDAILVGEATYQAIKQSILSCSVLPGSMLTEAGLMAHYAVGKSTCRLALARLTHEGLIRSIPRHGYMVASVTLKDVEEVFGLRLILEPEAARMAAGRIDGKALLRIDRSVRSNPVPKNHGNRINFFLDANREFHLSIALASGNDRLVKSISSLFDEMIRLVALGFYAEDDKPQISDDHRLLVEALEAGDGKLAAKITRRHIETFRDMTMERVLRSLKHDMEQRPLNGPLPIIQSG